MGSSALSASHGNLSWLPFAVLGGALLLLLLGVTGVTRARWCERKTRLTLENLPPLTASYEPWTHWTALSHGAASEVTSPGSWRAPSSSPQSRGSSPRTSCTQPARQAVESGIELARGRDSLRGTIELGPGALYSAEVVRGGTEVAEDARGAPPPPLHTPPHPAASSQSNEQATEPAATTTDGEAHGEAAVHTPARKIRRAMPPPPPRSGLTPHEAVGEGTYQLRVQRARVANRGGNGAATEGPVRQGENVARRA